MDSDLEIFHFEKDTHCFGVEIFPGGIKSHCAFKVFSFLRGQQSHFTNFHIRPLPIAVRLTTNKLAFTLNGHINRMKS